MTDQAFIEAVKRGHAYCSGCGQPKIPASEAWKSKCSACFAMNKQASWCKGCGNPLERSRMDYAKQKGGECAQCYYCAKKVTQPHPLHGVKLPDRFHLTLQ